MKPHPGQSGKHEKEGVVVNAAAPFIILIEDLVRCYFFMIFP